MLPKAYEWFLKPKCFDEDAVTRLLFSKKLVFLLLSIAADWSLWGFFSDWIPGSESLRTAGNYAFETEALGVSNIMNFVNQLIKILFL